MFLLLCVNIISLCNASWIDGLIEIKSNRSNQIAQTEVLIYFRALIALMSCRRCTILCQCIEIKRKWNLETLPYDISRSELLTDATMLLWGFPTILISTWLFSSLPEGGGEGGGQRVHFEEMNTGHTRVVQSLDFM